MRRFIFLAIVIILTGSGIWLIKHKGETSIELPFIDGFSTLFESEETKAKKQKAASILVGKWNVTSILKGKNSHEFNIYRFIGDAEYKDDGTFIRNVFEKHYKGIASRGIEESEKYFRDSGFASVTGNWSINMNPEGSIKSWSETYLDCRIDVTKGSINVCEWFSQESEYGTYLSESEDARHQLTTFNDSLIIVEAIGPTYTHYHKFQRDKE